MSCVLVTWISTLEAIQGKHNKLSVDIAINKLWAGRHHEGSTSAMWMATLRQRMSWQLAPAVLSRLCLSLRFQCELALGPASSKPEHAPLIHLNALVRITKDVEARPVVPHRGSQPG